MFKKEKNSPVGFILIALLVVALGVGAWWYTQGASDTAASGSEEIAQAPGTESVIVSPPADQEAAVPFASTSQETGESAPAVPEEKVTIDVEKAIAPRTIGNADAPIKIIEYASLTCSHCAHFHNDVLPELKSKYVDTGKVFIEFREFPLNDPALKATMTARCLPADKYEGFVDLLFKTQERWAGGLDYMPALRQNAKLAGMSDATFDACQNSRELMIKIADGMQAAKDKWKIEATPTFILNDGKETISGAMPIAEFERVFRKLTNDAVGAAPAVQ